MLPVPQSPLRTPLVQSSSRETNNGLNQADTVKLDLNIYQQHGLIHMVCACNYSLTNFMNLISVIRDECLQYGCKKVLSDLTQVVGEVEAVDWFWLARHAAEAWRTIQVAIVYLDVASAVVFEHVAVSRRARVRVFPLVRPALHWLLPGMSATYLIDQRLAT